MDSAASAGPLTGVRLLEIGHYVAAPFCTRVLADLGADIIKIEPPGGDPVRGWGESVDGQSLWWSVHARNKRSISLDLRAEGAVDVVLALVRQCDGLVENMRPGGLARLGLSDTALREANPRLVIAHISGFGQDGPYRQRAAFGVIGESVGGLRHLSDHPPGTSDLPPVRVGISIGDSITGIYAALGLVAAMWQRDRGTGEGPARTIDAALSESVLSLLEGTLPEYSVLGKIRQPTGSGIPTAAPSNAYPTSDGKWVLIAGNSGPIFQRLSTLIGRPELPQDPRFSTNAARVANVVALDAIIGEWTGRFAFADVVAALEGADVPSAGVYDAADIAADPQFRHRAMVQEVEDPVLGRPVLHPGIVPRVDEDPGSIRWTGPAIGQHTQEVLREAGFTAAQIADLEASGVVRSAA